MQRDESATITSAKAIREVRARDPGLREAGAAGLRKNVIRSSTHGTEAPPSDDVKSPETYVGYARAEKFASPERMARDSRRI